MTVPRIPMPPINLRKHTPADIAQRVQESRAQQRRRLDDMLGKQPHDQAPRMPQPRPGESISLPSGRRVPRR